MRKHLNIKPNRYVRACPGLFAAVVLILAVGCDRPEPVTYKIPNEDRQSSEGSTAQPGPPRADGEAAGSGTPAATNREVAAAPTTPTAPVDPATGNNMRVLPGMQEAADAAGAIRYSAPEGWQEYPASGIRKANFRIAGETGSAELAVTVFPGDVGGTLANVNRWRGQIGLDPIDAAGLDATAESYPISDHAGTLVRLEGPEASILGALLPFHGFTWFFKLQGDVGVVAEQDASMRRFLDSVRIEDDNH